MNDSHTSGGERCHVMTGWCSSEPGSTHAVLLISTGTGHHTEHVDMQVLDDWLTEHHPEVYGEQEGVRMLDVSSLPDEIMRAALAHNRKVRSERAGVSVFELGCLVDPGRMQYAQSRPWKHQG